MCAAHSSAAYLTKYHNATLLPQFLYCIHILIVYHLELASSQVFKADEYSIQLLFMWQENLSVFAEWFM